MTDFIYCSKTEAPILPNSTYFETCLKYWQDPHIVACESVFKTIDSKPSETIPVNAFEISECLLAETNETG